MKNQEDKFKKVISSRIESLYFRFGAVFGLSVDQIQPKIHRLIRLKYTVKDGPQFIALGWRYDDFAEHGSFFCWMWCSHTTRISNIHPATTYDIVQRDLEAGISVVVHV